MAPPAHCPRPVLCLVAVVTAAVLLDAGHAAAQAAAPWLQLAGETPGYVEIPHHPDLNPSAEITVEAWVNFTQAEGTGGNSCPSIVGKSYTEAYWLGMCGQRMRFYPRGAGSARDSNGVIPLGQWAHIAATFDGTNIRFFVDGALDSEFAVTEPGPPTASEAPLRIGSDWSYNYSPFGAVDEVRLWSVARTAGELAATMGAPLDGPQPGLVGVWHLDGDADDAVGGHHGVLVGAAEFSAGDPVSCPHHYAVAAGGHLPGDAGSQWVTDLVLLNTADSEAQATLFLLPRNTDNTASPSAELVIPGGRALELPDVVLTTFGRSNAAAALRVCSNQPLAIFSRTYNDGGEGTFGQGIPGRRESDATAAGGAVHLAGLQESTEFRTNVGFTNLSTSEGQATVDLYDGSGTLLGSRTYSIPPYGHIQRNRVFTEVTPGAVVGGVAKVRVEAGRLLVYGSVVDAATNDPTFFLAE